MSVGTSWREDTNSQRSQILWRPGKDLNLMAIGATTTTVIIATKTIAATTTTTTTAKCSLAAIQ